MSPPCQMLQGIKKTDLDPERVMEGRITDNVDIESVKVSGQVSQHILQLSELLAQGETVKPNAQYSYAVDHHISSLHANPKRTNWILYHSRKAVFKPHI